MRDANEGDGDFLRDSERLRDAAALLYGGADFFAGVFDADSRLLYANDVALGLVDVSLDDIAGEQFVDTPWFDDDPDAKIEFRERLAAAADGDPQRYDSLVSDSHEARLHVSIDMRPLRDDDGVFAVAVTATDVSRRENLETAHDANLLALEAVYSTIADKSLSFEERVEKLLQVGRERLGLNEAFYTKIDGGVQMIRFSIGDHPLLQRGEQAPLADSYCKRTIADDDGQFAISDAGNTELATDSGYQTYSLEMYVGSEVRSGDATHGTLCFADRENREEPISETEQAFVNLLAEYLSKELEHRERERGLERQAARLDRFAAVVTHDLRAPLSVAEGRLDLAASRLDEDDEALAGVRDAQDALDRMDELVTELRALAREGEVVSEPEPVEFAEAAQHAASTALPPEATLHVDDDAGEVLHADPERLRTVFENLFTNAVQHGGEGVTVTVTSVDPQSGGGAAGFSVVDDGPGFGESDPEVVFGEGYTTRDDATGYGLSIVEAIVEAHGWTIAASTDSATGGARFDVRGVEFDPEL
jgi:GAF domain-containing protein